MHISEINKVTRLISRLHQLLPHLHKNKYLNIKLNGGLCNKLHCLFSACDIAISRNATLVEPYFGWKVKILFSDIFDIDYFNSYMSKFTKNNSPIMARKENIKKQNIKFENNLIHLWKYAEIKNKKEQKIKSINTNATKLHVLKALRLKPEYQEIVEKKTLNRPFTTLQVRTESDWVAYSSIKKTNTDGESILVNQNKILNMLSEFNVLGELFFTSGENHDIIAQDLERIGLKSDYFFDATLEYEINAAINFEICCNADAFIGLSRSSYSNLISLKRAALLENDNSYIYNYNDVIIKRQDKGLFSDAKKSIECNVEITT